MVHPAAPVCEENNSGQAFPELSECKCECLIHSRPQPRSDLQPPSFINLCKSRVKVLNFVYHGVLKDCPVSLGSSEQKADGLASDAEDSVCSEESVATYRAERQGRSSHSASRNGVTTDSGSESDSSIVESHLTLRELAPQLISSPTTQSSASTTKSLSGLLSSPSPMKGIVSTASGSIGQSSRMPSLKLVEALHMASSQLKQTRSARLKSPYGQQGHCTERLDRLLTRKLQKSIHTTRMKAAFKAEMNHEAQDLRKAFKQQEKPHGAQSSMPCSKRASRQVLRTLKLLHREAEDQDKAAAEMKRTGRPRSSL